MSILSAIPRTTILDDLEKLFRTGPNRRLYTSIGKRLDTASPRELYTSIGYLLFGPGMREIQANGLKPKVLLKRQLNRLLHKCFSALPEPKPLKKKT